MRERERLRLRGGVGGVEVLTAWGRELGRPGSGWRRTQGRERGRVRGERERGGLGVVGLVRGLFIGFCFQESLGLSIRFPLGLFDISISFFSTFPNLIPIPFN